MGRVKGKQLPTKEIYSFYENGISMNRLAKLYDSYPSSIHYHIEKRRKQLKKEGKSYV